MNRTWRTGLIAGVALIAATACSKKGSGSGSMDDALRADLEQAGASGLELAPKVGRQMVVSPIEGGPRAAPAPVLRRVGTTVRRPAPRRTVAARPETAPASPRATVPTPTPQPAPQSHPQQRQPGVYSTEAEIFRQMPWIRP